MTELRTEPYELPAARLGPENPLPRFRDERSDVAIQVDESVSQEERRHLGWQLGLRVLPYRLQDSWDRNKQPGRFDSIVLENEFLLARFLPGWGGRMVSLIHKPAGRELLERNPVFQPANIAIRGAWFAGGVEWNTGGHGHACTTCSPLFAARIEGPGGVPVLRMYEWERVRCYPWQIDFHLPPRSPVLFARVRIVNPHDDVIPMYWWTNISVPERRDDRTLAPSDSALYFDLGEPIHRIGIPVADGEDLTYPGRIESSQHTFFRIPDGKRPWIASLDREGRGLVETSTGRLRGRKLFSWGTTPGGRHWQEFLAAPGSRYIEIQAGLTRTQEECIPMPAGAEWAFTHAFGCIDADPARVHGTDWTDACRCVESALDAMIGEQDLEDAHEALGPVAARSPAEILHYGSGWGALERHRLAVAGQPDPLPPELAFPEDSLAPEQEPWLRLLDAGTLGERDPQQDPGACLVQEHWCDLLEHAVESGRGGNWVEWLHLGVMRMEAGDPEGARAAWENSIERQPSAWAMRNLAVLEQRAGNPERACDWMHRACRTGPLIAPLAIEYAKMLADLDRHEALAEFVAGLPEPLGDNERLQIYQAAAALRAGDLESVAALFEREFATIREGETVLTDLWFGMQEQRLAAEEEVPVDEALRERVRREYPLPKHADFRQRAAIE